MIPYTASGLRYGTLKQQTWAVTSNKSAIHREIEATPTLTLRSHHSSTQLEDAMERELTPVEARGGVISGRIVTILAISFVGAVIALAGVWAIVGMPK